jgi:PKD domain
MQVNLYCKKANSCDGCKENNKPPIVSAGPDQVITLPIDSILLDGSASRDPDGAISEWLWKKISGPASYNIVNAAAQKTVVKNLDTGIYQFELVIKDDLGLSTRDTMQVTVGKLIPSNRSPIADAGNDTTIILPFNTVMLDGSRSTDPDNNIVSYLWTKISGPSSFSIVNANASQTQVINFVQGVYQFELKVTDNDGLISKDTVIIEVLLGGITEKIFTDLVWTNQCYQDIPGACWINGDAPSYGFFIRDTTNILPNNASTIAGLWVKMDASSEWEEVPLNCWQYPDPYPRTNFTYCLTPDSLSVFSWFFSPTINLEGKKAIVKIRF